MMTDKELNHKITSLYSEIKTLKEFKNRKIIFDCPHFFCSKETEDTLINKEIAKYPSDATFENDVLKEMNRILGRMNEITKKRHNEKENMILIPR